MSGCQTGFGSSYYLDDVSVVDVNTSNLQLLNNPSFENSTIVPNGWTVLCTESCDNSGTKINNNNKCRLSTGTCLKLGCHNSISFLGLNFSTIFSHIYTISYRSMLSGSAHSENHFYVVAY